MPIVIVMYRKIIALTVFILLFPAIYGQDSRINELPRGYLGVELGLSLDGLKSALAGHPYLQYRGDPDVSLLSKENEKLVQCRGLSFVNQGSFQLFEGKVYIVAFMLNTDKIDYYTMFVTLSKKYGDPDSLSPTQAVWEGNGVRMSLEKPLTVKYIDTGVFTGKINESKKQESLNVKEREDFLEGF